MRMKNITLSIANLNPEFTKPLQAFDLMHKSMTGEEIVITSANDGKHMKGSKHYTNDAVDVRRWAFDKLNKAEKSKFHFGMFRIFDDPFDYVLEKDHWHIEYDPKPRKLIDEDLEPKRPCPGLPSEHTIEIKPTKLPKLDIGVNWFEQINWTILPKALMNGVFRYFTKFNLFLQAHKPSWIDKLIELLRTLINKITTKLKGSK